MEVGDIWRLCGRQRDTRQRGGSWRQWEESHGTRSQLGRGRTTGREVDGFGEGELGKAAPRTEGGTWPGD